MNRVDLLKPSPKVRKLALKRIEDSALLVNTAGKLEVTGYTLAEVKIALLLAHIANPYETFGIGEEMMIRGIKRSDTLSAARLDKHFRPL